METWEQRAKIAEANELAAFRSLVPRLLQELADKDALIDVLEEQLGARKDEEHGGF